MKHFVAAAVFGVSVVLVLTVGPHTVAGQTPARTRLITLGTRSGPLPTAARAQSSNVVAVNGSLYVVDAGDGATRRLAEAGVSIRNIEAIFLTHLHDDHTSGLVPLMSVEYDLDRSVPVGVYGPAGTGALVSAALQFLKINSDIRVSEGTRARPIGQVFAGHDVAPGVVFRDANITVRAAENDHFHFPQGSPAYGTTKSYSYRLEGPDRSIVFSGDTGPSSGLVELAKSADLLVIEVSNVEELKALRVKDGSWARWTPAQQEGWVRHMVDEHLTAEDVGRMAAAAGVKGVVLTHLPASEDPQDKYERYAETTRRFFTGQVRVAEDLMEF